jgi:hypothetical protein
MKVSVGVLLLLLSTVGQCMRVYSHDYTMKDLSFVLDRANLKPSNTVNSNLKAPNWIYGGFTNEEFKLQTFRTLTSGNNIVKCQLEVPFYNGERCITCTGNAPYFNIKSKKCESCPDGMEAHRCK